MTTNKTSSNHEKIIKGMDQVYDKLIEFKKRMNSELVILRDNKILHIKP